MPITPRTLPILVALLAAAVLAAPASPATPPPPVPFGPVEIVPGITEEQIVQPGPQVIHVVRITPGPLIAVGPMLTGGGVSGVGLLSAAMAARLEGGAVAAINGDALNVRKTAPDGILLAAGELMSSPDPGRTALLLGPAGFGFGRMTLLGRYQAESPKGFSRTFDGLNRPPDRVDETVIYTSRYGPTTPPPTGAPRFEAVVQIDANAPPAPNTTLLGTVVATSAGGTPIAPGQVIISGNGTTAATVAGLAVGRRVSIALTVDGLPAGFTDGLGGGPALVINGAAVTPVGETFSSIRLSAPTTRSAIGRQADGTILLVAAEGADQHSLGVSISQMGQIMLGLGAVHAMAFDSGKAAQVALGDRLLVSIKGAEPTIPDALVVIYKGVQLGQVPDRITPNGDGVDDAADTTVRAPTVGGLTVTMESRDGASSTQITRGRFGPGAAPIRINPAALHLPDGAYVITARFVPANGSTTTEATRTMVVDRTLSFLRLRSANVVLGTRSAPQPQLRVGFRLSRQARVTVRLKDSKGVQLRLLASKRLLKPGPQVITWDRSLNGKRARPGSYTVDVVARTTLGVSTLTRSIVLKSTKPPTA
jgi:phosphodiester glycosidase